MLRQVSDNGISQEFCIEVLDPSTINGKSDVFDVEVDARQPICPIEVGGRQTGYMIGYAVDIDKRAMVQDRLILDPAKDAAALAKQALDALSGSFLLLIDYAGEIWAYPDASATVGLVYSPDRKKAGSSAKAVFGSEYDALLRRDLIRAFAADNDGWFTAGLTAHIGLYRLLPNHRLNLSTWQVERFWPEQMPPYRQDIDQVLIEMGKEIDTVVSAIAREHPVTQTLTGGNETRAVLACNSNKSQTEFMTLSLPVSGLDVYLATKLARLQGLTHYVIKGVRADAGLVKAWIKAAGHGVSGMNAIWSPSVSTLKGRYLIGGLGGEVGRGFLWPSDLRGDEPIDAAMILALLKLPQYPLLLPEVKNWLESLPADLDAFQVLDLAYLELRLGPWAYGQARLATGPTDVSPLIGRRQFKRMWSLPPKFRKSPGFLPRLVELHDPSLLTVPINRYGDWRDKLTPFLRAARRPDRAFRKIKQILSVRWTSFVK